MQKIAHITSFLDFFLAILFGYKRLYTTIRFKLEKKYLHFTHVLWFIQVLKVKVRLILTKIVHREGGGDRIRSEFDKQTMTLHPDS